MRTFIALVGILLCSGFVLLGILVAAMGEGRMPARGGSVPISGPATYSMGAGWVALGVTIFCASLLMAEIGQKYYIRKVRDWSFFIFGVCFITTLLLGVRTVYGSVAL